MNFKKILIFILFTISFNLFAQNKVIIFWYGMGKGHLIPAERIAEYVKETYQKKSERVDIKLVDLREFSIYDSKTEEKGKRKYLDWAGKESDSYTQYFEWYLEQKPQDITSNFDLYRLAKYLINEKPKAIITVFWGAAHAFYLLKQLYPESFKTPVSLLYTDYGVRKFAFMVPTVDKIFFGSQEMVNVVTKRYPELTPYKANFDFSGIPINIDRIRMLQKENEGSVKKSLGLNPNAPVITIARGGEVFLPVASLIEKTLNKISSPNQQVQIVMLAGKAQRDRDELENLEKKYSGQVKIVGFIPNDEYLAYIKASDIFITKPGGAGLTEAGLTGVPIILMPGLGGQENDNLKAFVENKMAIFEKDENAIVEKTRMILNNPNIAREMVQKQREFFAGYDPSKIAEWAFYVKGESNWDEFKKEIELKDRKAAMQKNTNLDPIALKNWFFYLNEISLSDISKDRSFQKTFQEKAQIYINRAISTNKTIMAVEKIKIKSHRGPLTREYYITKWRLFRRIILDHALHINLHQTYKSPEREYLDSLTKDLIRFLNTDIFAKDLGVHNIWEFSKGSIYTFLAEFYYLSRLYPKAQENVSLALKEFPLDHTNESLIMLQADIYLRLKKPKQAIEFLKFYLSKNPDYDYIRVRLAKILNEENLIKEAEENSKWLLSRRAKLDEEGYFTIASIYLKNNRLDEALEVLFKGLNARPDSFSLLALAIRLISNNETLKKNNEKKLAELIGRYKVQREIELKKLEDLPLLLEGTEQLSGKEGFFGN